MTRFFVPGDAAAVSVGADEVAAALTGQPGVEVVRTGSRGMLWLEPLVEVATADGRVGFANVTPGQVGALLADAASVYSRQPIASAGPAPEAGHPAYLGPLDEHPWMTRQARLTTARLGVIDPADPDDYARHGGWIGLRRALGMAPEAVVEEVVASGLRGRGGAGFPAGVKWRTVAGGPGPLKFVTINADEGDSGTFADRMLMEGDPFALIEGMAITAWAVGASEGYVFIRSEYPHAIATMRRAIETARTGGWLGPDVLGSGLAFDVEVRVGAGAYICGEETSMLSTIEGRRGEVRAKPPIPALSGLFGRPTVVNNVLTVAAVPSILADGPEAYAAHGVDRSRGTQVFQLAGNVARGGLVEVDFGITLRDLVEGFGGGTRSGRPVRAVQVGGPLGAYVPADRLDVPLAYEAMADAGFMLGHGGVVVFDDTVDMGRMARFAMEFCAKESCGKCTPCRIGSQRGVETIDRLVAGGTESDRRANLALLQDLCTTMERGSLCAMGGLTPMPVRSALTYFPEDFGLSADGEPR
ncbi:MAG TPA: NADH-ubiquinone oxidoreductase-F iron-sulfur binding region domain-containing protein [Dermatophilaceae bacterium]|nr:NADH-ubiquinone oxidoreductase-F iron-sulfur binding region domain-containing protein [Dermatophilaceae bacterium]HOR14186.1 NADH-ubiquinone oxidoreductase-F iron-sulfur binding region domain-containing protein [Dermatophilaceae bacterium]HPK87956.1 NADH-ubiquinone oxidoreductase-F iron-sulfur binding region domain-containing protein [Dermatophilaceae bacterium]HQH88866.1 NADH-ubiquinone oxidoreductase-F iron-sulfur binding region domain-containing protein [Dermatophilaceae bacterium]